MSTFTILCLALTVKWLPVLLSLELSPSVMCPERVFQLQGIKGCPAQGSPVGGQLHWTSGQNQKAELVCEAAHVPSSWDSPAVARIWWVRQSPSAKVQCSVLARAIGAHWNTSLPGAQPALSIKGGVLDAPDPPWCLLWSLPAGSPTHRKRPQPECHALHRLVCLQLCPQGHHKPVQQPLWPLLFWKHLQLQQCLGVKDDGQWARDEWQSVSRVMNRPRGQDQGRLCRQVGEGWATGLGEKRSTPAQFSLCSLSSSLKRKWYHLPCRVVAKIHNL